MRQARCGLLDDLGTVQPAASFGRGPSALILVLQQVAGLGIKMLWLSDVSRDVREEDWAKALLASAEGLLGAATVLDAELDRLGVEAKEKLAHHYEELRDMAQGYLIDENGSEA